MEYKGALVLAPAIIAVSAVGLGLLFGLAPSGAGKVVGPLRTFALTTALAVAGTHLLPEAFAELGALGLLVFALGLSLPALFRFVHTLLPPRPDGHRDVALEFGYAGLLVHHVADGLGLGAYGGHAGEVEHAGHAHHGQAHGDVLVALAVHTVPLVAVVTLAYRSAEGVKAAVLRSAGLAAASLLGIVVSAAVSVEQGARFEAWVAAAVAGLLVHVVTHDLERDLPETPLARTFDVAAATAGVVVSLVAAAELEPALLASGALRIRDVLFYVAPPLAVAFLISAWLDTWLARLPPAERRRSPFRVFSVARALRLREHPEVLGAATGRAGFAALLFASAVGFDVLFVSLWLAGPIVELFRLLGVLLLAALAFAVLPRPASAQLDLQVEAKRAFIANFMDQVSRASPWLVTSILLAAMLDASLAPLALASAEPWSLLVSLTVVSLFVQVEAVAAAPVLAVLVFKGLPAGAAVGAWIAIGAPGGRGLLALLSRGERAKRLLLLSATLVAALAAGAVVLGLGLSFVALGARSELEGLGLPAALLLALPVLLSVWRGGLRGWLSTVFLHTHHAHESAGGGPTPH